jgi:hypothetical protein
MGEHLLLQVKEIALERRMSVSAVIEEAVQEKLRRLQVCDVQPAWTATTVCGDGLAPGMDLDDGAALLDHLGREES